MTNKGGMSNVYNNMGCLVLAIKGGCSVTVTKGDCLVFSTIGNVLCRPAKPL